MKRYRASIYIDIEANDPAEARTIAEEIASILGDPNEDGFVNLPEGFYNPYYGGVGEIVQGDLLQTAKNLENI